MEPQCAGWIIVHKIDHIVFGFGNTEDEAWNDVLQNCEISDTTKWESFPASDKLLFQLKEYGGYKGWENLDGIAVTQEEKTNWFLKHVFKYLDLDFNLG